MRVKTGFRRHRRHQAILKQTKGMRMSYHRLIKRAKEAVLHAGEYAFRGRRERKRDMKRLWIQRINAALHNVEGAPNYSRFIALLEAKQVKLNRKVLSHLAVKQPSVFEQIVQKLV